MTFIKMCGLQDEATVDLAVELGVDAVGFVLAESPRRISPDRAATLRPRVPAETLAVGVYVKMPLDEIIATARAANLDHVQVHDLRSADDVRVLHDAGFTVIRAVNTGGAEALSEDYGADLLLVDGAVAGAGKTWDWQDAVPAVRSVGPRGRAEPRQCREGACRVRGVGCRRLQRHRGRTRRQGSRSHAAFAQAVRRSAPE